MIELGRTDATAQRELPPAQIEPLASKTDQLTGWLLRHGVLILLLTLLVFGLLPFLAPVLMAAGWSGPAQILYRLYALLCHQLPQRSWFLFGEKLTYTLEEIRQVYPLADGWQMRAFIGTPEMGWKVAWSDRMMSLYTMIPVFGLLGYGRSRRMRPISLRCLVFLLLPLVLDGTTHMLNDVLAGFSGTGFRDTNLWLAWLTDGAFPGFYAGDHQGTLNWWLRLLTGLIAAWGVAEFVFPRLDRLLRAEAARYPTPTG